MRKSEKAVLIIGMFNIFLLTLASALSSNRIDSGMISLILVHIIIIIGAFPILYRAIISSYSSSRNFTIFFTAISILSALLIIFSGSIDLSDADDPYFFVLGLIELLPIAWLYLKKKHIIWQPHKKLPYDSV